ncbi:MAG: hypothetical protein AB1725_07850 [Armatimonadota bacterium]
MQPTYQQEKPGNTADRVVGIIGIVLFTCCSLGGAAGFVLSGGPDAPPPELLPETWQAVAGLLVHVALLIGCIGILLGGRWGFLLTGIAACVAIALFAFDLSQYPARREFGIEYLESGAGTEQQRAAVNAMISGGPLFAIPPALVYLVYAVFSLLRLGGKFGPKPS